MTGRLTHDPRLAALLDRELDPGYRRRVAAVMEWLPPSNAPDAHIVDIGCGRGYFAHYYATLGQRALTGIEFDADIAGTAATAHAGHPGVLIVRGDGAALPLANASCSGAILSEIIEHVDDDVALLREAWRVLRPGAAAAITVPHANYPWAWDPLNHTLARAGLGPIRRGPLAGIWAGHLRLYTIAQLRAAVQAAGFVIEEERAMVRYCLPFAHNLLYGIGKPLLESGWLPRSLTGEIDRYRVAAVRRSRMAAALHAVMSHGDARNAMHEGFAVPSMGIGVKARKPA